MSMTNEEYEKHFTDSCARRDEFWKSIGKVDPDVITHLINPSFMGGPTWPSLRQAFVVVRTDTSTIIASDGLSDPFSVTDEKSDEDSDEQSDGTAGNGYGLEFYVETPGNLDPVAGSWQFEMLWQMSQNAAQAGSIQSLIQQYKYMTTELYDVSVPKEFQNAEGRTGVLLGLENKRVPSKVALSLEAIDIINIKLLTLKELKFVVKNGKEGRDQLAGLLLKEENPTYSDLKRQSVVSEKPWWKF